MSVDSSPRSVQALLDDFARVTDQIISLDGLRERLLSDRQLRLKYGVDLTAPDLHIGHAVNLWMYERLQQLGHKVVFLLGDFTTSVGDPTGRSQTRPVLPSEQIEANAEAIQREVLSVLQTGPDVLEIRRNSEWYRAMPTREFLSILSLITQDQLVARDMFRTRQAVGTSIYMHEFVYPVLQGYDSVKLEADATIIGTDQLYNEMMGRSLQEKFGQAPQVVVTTVITPGLDGGEKQSKSLGNYIGLSHSPRDKFGRAMRLRDDLLREFLTVYTDLPLSRVEKIMALDPMEAKLQFAESLVGRYHGRATAADEREWFERRFRHRIIPDDIPVIRAPAAILPALELLRLVPEFATASNSDLRRRLEQGSVRVDGEKLQGDPRADVVLKPDGSIMQVGKRRVFRVVPADRPA